MKTEIDARACETLAGSSRLEKPILREKTNILLFADFRVPPKTKKIKMDAWSQGRLVW